MYRSFCVPTNLGVIIRDIHVNKIYVNFPVSGLIAPWTVCTAPIAPQFVDRSHHYFGLIVDRVSLPDPSRSGMDESP